MIFFMLLLNAFGSDPSGLWLSESLEVKQFGKWPSEVIIRTTHDPRRSEEIVGVTTMEVNNHPPVTTITVNVPNPKTHEISVFFRKCEGNSICVDLVKEKR